METAEAGNKHLGFGCHSGGRGGVAALGAVAAVVGVLGLLLFLVEGCDGGHRLAGLGHPTAMISNI